MGMLSILAATILFNHRAVVIAMDVIVIITAVMVAAERAAEVYSTC